MFLIDNNLTIWGANHPLSPLKAELRRMRLQRVREAGMQGRLLLTATSTHYDYGAQPRSKVEPREENRMVWENPCGTAEYQRTTQLT